MSDPPEKPSIIPKASSVPYKVEPFPYHFLRHTLKYCLYKSLSGLEYSVGNITENAVVEVLVFSSLSNSLHSSSRTSLTPFLPLVPTWTISYQDFLENWFTNPLRVERTNTIWHCFLQVITETEIILENKTFYFFPTKVIRGLSSSACCFIMKRIPTPQHQL